MISSRNWASSPLVSRAELCWILESSAFLYSLIFVLSWWAIVVKNHRKSLTCWVWEKKNDVLSLPFSAVFLAQDFAITDFSTPAGPHIHSKRCCYDWFIQVVQAVISSICCIWVPLRQLDLYDSVSYESWAASAILLPYNILIPIELRC